jgi:hypothetical protein
MALDVSGAPSLERARTNHSAHVSEPSHVCCGQQSRVADTPGLEKHLAPRKRAMQAPARRLAVSVCGDATPSLHHQHASNADDKDERGDYLASARDNRRRSKAAPVSLRAAPPALASPIRCSRAQSGATARHWRRQRPVQPASGRHLAADGLAASLRARYVSAPGHGPPRWAPPSTRVRPVGTIPQAAS